VHTHRRLKHLKDAIDKISQELSINPTNSELIQSQLDPMLKVIDSLSDADWVRSIVREGESKTTEFKETLSMDVKKQTKEKYIELLVLKTVVAFLNTEGGNLIIGITDDGQIPGVNFEIKKFFKNSDKFLLHLKNLIKKKIGEQFYPFVNYRLIDIDSRQVLLVECKASEDPCYLDDIDFYVRTNPATDKLEGPKLVKYIQHHFGHTNIIHKS
jgi:predicted HTH transcriptional regulator